MWEDPTEILEAARALMLECPTFADLIGGAANCHYPRFDVTQDGLPAALFEEGEYEAERHAHGQSYGKGTVVVVLYVESDSVTLGQLEKQAAAICREAAAWDGESLAITSARRGRATDPSEAQRVCANDTGGAASYRTITILLPWEG